MLFSGWGVAQTQITTGVIQGTIADQSGAVVPDASVEVRNADTNLTRRVSTDEAGRFSFLQLQPGPYALTVRKAGFANLVQENLTLTVGQAITLNLAMKVSSIDETITITASPAIDTAKIEASSTLNERRTGTKNRRSSMGPFSTAAGRDGKIPFFQKCR